MNFNNTKSRLLYNKIPYSTNEACKIVYELNTMIITEYVRISISDVDNYISLKLSQRAKSILPSGYSQDFRLISKESLNKKEIKEFFKINE